MYVNFTIAKDGQDWIVLSTETNARSFAMVPVGHTWLFESKADAAAQAKRLSGKQIKTDMAFTPDRFEAVADTVYGVAW